MRRWELIDKGEPGTNLELVEVPDPELRAGQLLVEVEAVGLAFPDVLQCRGIYQVPTPPRFTPGGETAGRVAALGDGVEGFAVGDRVAVMGGGLAKKVAVAAQSAFVVPDGVSAEAAAAIPINYGTTWYALHERGHLQPGETMLVTGAAGGTGTAAIQLGKATGARIIAVAGGAEKVKLAEEVGADVVIDHQLTPDWVDAVREASGGGVDVAYDPVGGDTFHQVRRCMAWGGRLLIIGFVAGIPDAPMNHVLLKSYDIVGVHWGASVMRDPSSVRRQMDAVFELVGRGEFTPPLYPPFAFEDAAQALQDLADRKTWGKAVVTF
ncbi:MAG TPA: NADPH:quinone oxidoreductase family protein [Acidimicrobiales bacterium]|nr:NADPH:quinone oxidoreductase family protein [Acidimicrobiales bacterium]